MNLKSCIGISALLMYGINIDTLLISNIGIGKIHSVCTSLILATYIEDWSCVTVFLIAMYRLCRK